MVRSSYFSNKLDVLNLKLKAMTNSEIVFNNEYALRILTPESFEKYHQNMDVEQE